MKKDEIKIYTDGAARGNPGRAGWAAVVMFHNDKSKVESSKVYKVVEIGGRADHATNNIMELTAPIEAFKYIKKNNLEGEVEVVSDSKYVILGMTQWIANWQKNNWRNANKKPVLNRELWEELHALALEFKPKWTYIKGHNEDKYNERADQIATSFSENATIKLKNKR